MSGRGEPSYNRAHRQILFASRLVKHVTPESARDAVDAIRASALQPALVGTLERAGATRVSTFARASRRAAELSDLGDGERARRTLQQFQGALFVLARATLRGSLSRTAFDDAVSSLAAVPLGTEGDYEGRLVQWFAGVLDASRERAVATAPSATRTACPDPLGDSFVEDSLDATAIRLLAGASRHCPTVEWEGTQYRVDLARAEGVRLLRLLGDGRRPYFAAAREAVGMAAALDVPALSSDGLKQQRAALEALANSAEWEPEIRSALDDFVSDLRPRTVSRVAAALRLVADDLLARGLSQFVYAASLGQPDRVMVPASEAAARHDFGSGVRGLRGSPSAWQLPVTNSDGTRDWRMSGSLLGMDVSLAEFTLANVSMRPPSRSPTMHETERRAFVETVPLTEPTALEDAEARTIVTALTRGRTRVAGIRTGADADVLAGSAGFSQARRTMLSWTVEHDPEKVADAFAPIDLLRLGLEGSPPADLDAWGAPASPRTGCLCLSLDAPRPWELLAGRSAMVAAAFPDFKLRLAELLAELDMPASLLSPALAAATLDFVNTANPPGRHDRRAFESYVRGLRVDQVEQYLALLTTDGPLVPVDATPQANDRLEDARFGEARRP
jgi:hypothetical protein